MNTWSLLLAAIVCAADGDAAVPEPSVGVRDGQFVVRQTGEPFRPAGFNYIRLFNDARTADHDNFSLTGYDAAEHEAMLRRLAADGFNTVRVFINCQPGEVVDHCESAEAVPRREHGEQAVDCCIP